MCAILIAIHVPLLIKYHRLAKVCKAYEGTFVEFVSPAIGFACMRVKFTVNGEEKRFAKKSVAKCETVFDW